MSDFTNERTQAMRSKAAQRKLDAALFHAVRGDDGVGVMQVLTEGANPFAVSRGMTPLERALKFFPKVWSPVAVGALMAATGRVPVMDCDSKRKVFIDGLANHAQTSALTLMTSLAGEKERKFILRLIRRLLALSTCENDGVSSVAKVAFASAAAVEERTDESKVSWLHEVVCGGKSQFVGTRLANPSKEGLNWWALCIRSCYSNPRVLEHMLSLRPRLDARWMGMTPLHLAAYTGNEQALEALLRAGADPELPDGNDIVIGRGYGDITNAQLALIENYRLDGRLPGAALVGRARL